MKIVFMGTPDFAVPCLEKIISDGHEVSAVFCQPDRPKGRGHRLCPPPVKISAEMHGITVYQPETLRGNTEVFEFLKEQSPDCIVVVAYGKLLPPEILGIPKYGCINVHASLLPKYRGSAPIQWAVINGEKYTGVTTMLLDEGMDTGDILLADKCEIPKEMSSGELFEKLAPMGAELLGKTLFGLLRGTVVPEKQDGSRATRAPMLDKSMSMIDWTRPAAEIHDLIRGLDPWPCAATYAGDTKIKIFSSRIIGKENGLPGEVLDRDGLSVCCGDGVALELVEVQREGKGRMKAADMLRGYPIAPGTCLSNRID